MCIGKQPGNKLYCKTAGRKGITTSGKKLLVAPGITTSNKKLLVTRALLLSSKKLLAAICY